MSWHRATYGHEKTEWVGPYGVEMTAMGRDGWTVGTVGRHCLPDPTVFLRRTRLEAENTFTALVVECQRRVAMDALLGVDMYIVVAPDGILADAPGGTP